MYKCIQKIYFPGDVSFHWVVNYRIFVMSIPKSSNMEALFYEKVEGKVRCNLCPHFCLIPLGKTGICKVRRNVNGKLVAETWGNLSAANFDPV